MAEARIHPSAVIEPGAQIGAEVEVWRNDDGELAYAVQAPTGGMSRSNFRALIDGLVEGESGLARDATDAKLVKD